MPVRAVYGMVVSNDPFPINFPVPDVVIFPVLFVFPVRVTVPTTSRLPDIVPPVNGSLYYLRPLLGRYRFLQKRQK